MLRLWRLIVGRWHRTLYQVQDDIAQMLPLAIKGAVVDYAIHATFLTHPGIEDPRNVTGWMLFEYMTAQEFPDLVRDYGAIAFWAMLAETMVPPITEGPPTATTGHPHD